MSENLDRSNFLENNNDSTKDISDSPPTPEVTEGSSFCSFISETPQPSSPLPKLHLSLNSQGNSILPNKSLEQESLSKNLSTSHSTINKSTNPTTPASSFNSIRNSHLTDESTTENQNRSLVEPFRSIQISSNTEATVETPPVIQFDGLNIPVDGRELFNKPRLRQRNSDQIRPYTVFQKNWNRMVQQNPDLAESDEYEDEYEDEDEDEDQDEDGDGDGAEDTQNNTYYDGHLKQFGNDSGNSINIQKKTDSKNGKRSLAMNDSPVNHPLFLISSDDGAENLSIDTNTDINSDDDDIQIHRKRIRNRIAIEDESSQEKHDGSDPFEGIPTQDKRILKRAIRKARGSMPASHFIRDYWEQKESETPEINPTNSKPHNTSSNSNIRNNKGVATIKKSMIRVSRGTLRNFIDDSSQPNNNVEPYQVVDQERLVDLDVPNSSQHSSDSNVDLFDNENFWRSNHFVGRKDFDDNHMISFQDPPRNSMVLTEATRINNSPQPSSVILNSVSRDSNGSSSFLQANNDISRVSLRRSSQQVTDPSGTIDLEESKTLGSDENRKHAILLPEAENIRYPTPSMSNNCPNSYNEKIDTSEVEVLGVRNNLSVLQPEAMERDVIVTQINKYRKRLHFEAHHFSKKKVRPSTSSKDKDLRKWKKRLKGALPPSYLLVEDKIANNEKRLPSRRPKVQTKLMNTIESVNSRLQVHSEEETIMFSSDNEFCNGANENYDADDAISNNSSDDLFITAKHQRNAVDIRAFFRTKNKPEIDHLLSEPIKKPAKSPQLSKPDNRVSHSIFNRMIGLPATNKNQNGLPASKTLNPNSNSKKRSKPKLNSRIFGRVYAFPPNSGNIQIRKTVDTSNAKDRRVNKLVNEHNFQVYEHHRNKGKTVTKTNLCTINTTSKRMTQTSNDWQKNAGIEEWITDMPSDFDDPFTGEIRAYPSREGGEEFEAELINRNNDLNESEKISVINDTAVIRASESPKLVDPRVSVISKTTENLDNVLKTKKHKKTNVYSDYSNVLPLSTNLAFEKDSFIGSGTLEAVVTGIDPNPPNIWADLFEGPLDVVNFSGINSIFFSRMETFYNLFLTWCKNPQLVTHVEYETAYRFLTLACRFVASNVSGFDEINSERFLRELRTFMDNCLSLGLTKRPNEIIEKISITSLTFSVALVLPLFSSLTSIRSDIEKPIFHKFSPEILQYFIEYGMIPIFQHIKGAEILKSDQYYIMELATIIINVHNKAFKIQIESCFPNPSLSESLHIFGLLDTPEINTSFDNLESAWKSFYSFIPLLNFKSFVSVDSNLYWEFVVSLLDKTLNFINNNDLRTDIVIKGSLRFPKYLSDKSVFYLHAVLARISNLMTNWKWSGNNQIIKFLFDFFFNRDFYNVERWHVKSPLELTVLDEYKLEKRDSCFVQFLKLYANTVEYFIHHNDPLSIIHEINIVKVFSYHREDPLEEADLEALDNMYSFLLLRHKLAPLKLRLSRNQLSEFVNPRAIHASARYSVLKAWDSFMDIQLHRKGTRLLIAKDWFYNILGWAIKEYLLLLDYFKDKPNLLKLNTVPYIRFFVSAFTELKHWLSIEYVSHKDWKTLLSSFFAKSILTDSHVPEGILELYFSVLKCYVNTASQLASPDFGGSVFQPPRTKEIALEEITEWFSDSEIFTFKKFIALAFRKNDTPDFTDNFIQKAINTYTVCAEFLIRNKKYSLDDFIADYSEASDDVSKSKIYLPLFLAHVLNQISEEQFSVSENTFITKWMNFLVTEEINHEPEYAKSLIKKSPSIFTSEELESLSIFIESYSWNRSSIIKVVISSIKRLVDSDDWSKVNLGKSILSSLASTLISFVSAQNVKEDFHLLCLDSLQRIRETFPDISNSEISAVLNKYESKTEKIISNLKTKLTSKAFVRSSHHQHILNFITKKRDDYLQIFFKTFTSSFKDGVYIDDSRLKTGRDLFLKYTLAPYFLICRKGSYNQLIFLPPLCDLALKIVEFQASSALYFPCSAVTYLIASMVEYLAVSPLLSASSSQERIFFAISWKVFRTVLKLIHLQLFWVNDFLLSSEERTLFSFVIDAFIIIYGKNAVGITGLEFPSTDGLKDYERSDILKGFFSSTSETNNFKYDTTSHTWILSPSNPPKKYAPESINVAEYKRLALDEVYRFFREIYHRNSPTLTSLFTEHSQHFIESICERDDTLRFLLTIISPSHVSTSQFIGNSFIDSLA